MSDRMSEYVSGYIPRLGPHEGNMFFVALLHQPWAHWLVSFVKLQGQKDHNSKNRYEGWQKTKDHQEIHQDITCSRRIPKKSGTANDIKSPSVQTTYKKTSAANSMMLGEKNPEKFRDLRAYESPVDITNVVDHASTMYIYIYIYIDLLSIWGLSMHGDAPKWLVYNGKSTKMDDLGIPPFSITFGDPHEMYRYT